VVCGTKTLKIKSFGNVGGRENNKTTWEEEKREKDKAAARRGRVGSVFENQRQKYRGGGKEAERPF